MNLAKQHHEAMVAKGFWENPNLLEKKMLIISELGEAIEAHRKGDFCRTNEPWRKIAESEITSNPEYFKKSFTELVKDTYEDELADVVLRIWDYAEYTGITIDSPILVTPHGNVGEDLYYVAKAIIEQHFFVAISILYALSPNMDWHIKMKMAFNATRPHKHGKSY